MNAKYTPFTPTSIIRFARSGREVFLMNKPNPSAGWGTSAIAYPDIHTLQSTWNVVPDWSTLTRDQYSAYVVARRTA